MTDIAGKLRGVLGDAVVVTDPEVLDGRRHDNWVGSWLDDVAGHGAPRPACVVRPRDVADVVAVVNACREDSAPLVPFGLGSSVCGAIVASASTVVLDMGAMNRVRSVDARNLLASFDAGVRGSDAEAALEIEGLTLGHYPQSIGVSSVGGWVATRAAGQFSTAYGNVEDVLFSIEAVLPDGSVLRTKDTPRASAGPDLRQLLLGSEGTLGVVTGVTFSVRRVPELRKGAAYHVPSLPSGFEIQRRILHEGHAPPVLRLYDPVESTRMFGAHARPGELLLLVVHEGPRARAEAEHEAASKVALSEGASVAPEGAVTHWYEERNHVPTLKSLIDSGLIVDTVEIAATWDRIAGIYEHAIEALGQVPGLLVGSAHTSHAYRSGVNLYFTFAARAETRERAKETYRACYGAVLQATAAGGGGISHHHGIGRMRREWMRAEVGDSGIAALRAVKRALDPTGFMNPGALLPVEQVGVARARARD